MNCQTKSENKVKFNEICNFEQKTKKLRASDGKIKGKYQFFTSSQDKIMYLDEYEFKNKHIIMGRGGNPSVHIGQKFSVSQDDCYVITSEHLEYLYYFLLSNKDKLEHGFTGSTIKHLSKSFINNLDIPVPTKEKQKEIVEYCDNLSEMINKIEQQIKDSTNLMQQIMDLYLNQKDKKKKKKK